MSHDKSSENTYEEWTMKAFELATYWWQPSVFCMPRALTIPASISAACMAAYFGLISGSYWEAWDEPAPKPES